MKIQYRKSMLINGGGAGKGKEKSMTSLCSGALIKYNKCSTPELKHTQELIPEALSRLVN